MVSQSARRREMPRLIAGTMDQVGLGTRQRSTAGDKCLNTSNALPVVVAPIESQDLACAGEEVAVTVAGCVHRQGMCVNVTM